MADGNSELLAAFDQLVKSVNQVQISNSIARAQDQINKIRQDQTMNDFEKTKAQDALAHSMGLEVIARGGSAAMSEQARISLGTHIPDQAMRQMEATGETTFAGAQEALRQKAIKEEKDKLKYAHDLKMAELGVAFGAKAAAGTTKRLGELGKALDPNAARTGNFGKLAQVVTRAKSLDVLFQQYPDYNIPSTATTELATGIAALVSGGSPQSQAQIEHLTPKSMRGDANKMAAWLTNSPKGLEQQEFMKVLHDTALRERQAAEQQIVEMQNSRLAEYLDVLESSSPLVKAAAERIKESKMNLYGGGSKTANAASSAQNAQGYPVGQGLNKYIKINP